MGKFKIIISFVFYSILLFIIYAMLIYPAGIYDYIIGFILSFIVMFISIKLMDNLQLKYFSIKGIVFIIAYIPYFLLKIIQANTDVAIRVLNPKLPLKPAFVKVKCTNKEHLAKLMLANSITLTPGTLTLDIKEDYLIVHTIDESVYKDREYIKANFMHYIEEIVK